MQAERAGILYDQGRYDLAADEARRSLASDPQDAAVRIILSMALTQMERFTEATREARIAIAALPDEPMAHVAHAFALAQQSRFIEARDAAKEVLRLDSSDPYWHGLLANIELSLGNWQAAYEATTRGLAVTPGHSELLRLRSVAAVHLGRLNEAESVSDDAANSEPDSTFVLGTQGYQLMLAGNFREARALFTYVLGLDPRNTAALGGYGETIKAANPMYAVILRYRLWSARLSSARQAVLLFGPAVAFMVAWTTFPVGSTPHWFVLAFAGIWLLSATWLGIPVSTLVLMLHPSGRHVVNRDQRSAAVATAPPLAISLVGVAALAGGIDAGFFAAVSTAAAALPIYVLFRVKARANRVLFGLTTSIAVAAAAAATLLASSTVDTGNLSPWTALWIGVLVSIAAAWRAQVLI